MTGPSHPALETFQETFKHRRQRAACLCGSRWGIPVRCRDRYGLPIRPFFCLRCGHVYAKFRLEEADLDRFYAESYRALYAPGDGLKTPEAAASRIQKAREVLYPVFRSFFPDGAGRTVMEWGCGAGWNLVPFREAGVRALGFDFDRGYVEYGRTAFGLDLRVMERGPFDPMPSANGPVDFLILNHVLEHVADPFGLLKRASAWVKEGGVIFVGLPFLENLPIWGFKNYFHVAHLHYFSAPHFCAMAVSRGWDVMSYDTAQGWAALRPGRSSASGPAAFRLYNGLRLVQFAVIYGGLAPLGRTLRFAFPWLGRPMRRLKEFLLKGG